MQVLVVTTLKLDQRLSYLTKFACQFGKYRYKRLPFGRAPAGHMFQRKIDEIFKDLPKARTMTMHYEKYYKYANR